LFRFIQANYQTIYSNEKNASAALSGLVTQKILIFRPETSRHSPALEFSIAKKLILYSFPNKTKQPFTVFKSEGRSVRKFKKKFENFTLDDTK
jgi:hypothetical protein